MPITERASNFSRSAWPWLKAILTIALASAMLTAGFLPWTTRIHYDPWSALYKYQTEIQLALAAFAGVCPATLIYFAVTGRRFVATTVIALILMSATAIAAVLFGAAEEKLGFRDLGGAKSIAANSGSGDQSGQHRIPEKERHQHRQEIQRIIRGRPGCQKFRRAVPVDHRMGIGRVRSILPD